MKGPGVRIDIEVRRAWRCPVCGQNQRHTMDITQARCGCTRDGVPMKLAEEQRPDRKALRPEVRAMLDRIQAGEQFPRMASTGASDSDRPRGEGGDYRSNRRPPRRDQPDRPPRNSEPPREVVSPAAAEDEGTRMRDASTTLPTVTELVIEPPPKVPAAPTPSAVPADDAFGAGIEAGE